MTDSNGFTDLHGKQVHAFALQMANLGFERMTEELMSMLDSGAWQEFKDGLGTYRFLPGEFDYFLSLMGVSREHVMKGVTDLDAKARIEEHMDERDTGKDERRRRIAEVREAVPQRPGRTIEPFGWNPAEGKHLTETSRSERPFPKYRSALGTRVRLYRNTDHGDTRTERERRRELSAPVRARRLVRGMDDAALAALITELQKEQQRRAQMQPEPGAG